MLWQTRPTVIFGLHQNMAAEVNLPWCKEHGVEVYRRKSGGGCVYSDEGNLMISYIKKGDKTNAQRIFQEYLCRLAAVLRSLGLPAVTTGNNDVLVNGKKVSGNACHVVSGNDGQGTSAVVVHGTLLLHSNLEALTNAITPSAEKLKKHAVASVRQRVTNLSELGITDTDRVKETLVAALTGTTCRLTQADIAAINRIEQTYLLPEFINGR